MADNKPLLDQLALQEQFGGYTPQELPQASPSIPFQGLDMSMPSPSQGERTPAPSSLSALENSLLSIRDDDKQKGGSILRTIQDVSSDRYPNFMPGNYNNEDAYAQGQGWTSKMVNGVGKGLLLTGTTFLQSTVGLVNGLARAASDGRAASFYDNDLNRWVDDINNKANNYAPNYYKDVETNAAWYSPTKLLTANFLWDGIVKNMGFMAGAALAGNVFAGGIGAASRALATLPKAGKLFSLGKAAEVVAATEEGLLAADKAAETYGKVKSLSDKFLNQYNILNPGSRALVAGLSTTGEAGFEAFQNLNQFRTEKINEYRAAHGGLDPMGEALAKINENADAVGNASFLANVGLLSATNYIQFPKILGSSYRAEKGIVNDVVKGIGEITEQEGKYVSKASMQSKGIVSTLNKVRPYTFSASEGFEEGAQYAIQTGTQDYYNKKYNNKDTDFMDSIGVGIQQTLGTNEGMSNVLMGGLSGALMMGRGRYREGKALRENTEAAVNQFNKYRLSDFTKDTIDSVNRGTALQEERETLLKEGNVTDSKDIEHDYIINYLTPRIKYGRYDLVKSEIEDYRRLAMTDEGFSQLQAEGKALNTDTKEAYLERLNKFEQTAENTKSLYQSLHLRYGGITDKDKNPLYSPEVMDKLVYASSKISDYDNRIPGLTPGLINAGIDVNAVINDLLKGDDNSYNEAMTKLDGLGKVVDASNKTVLPEEVISLKEHLEDVGKMSLRRNQFLKEYDDIKKNPKNYQSIQPEDIETSEVDASGNLQTIVIKTQSGEKTLKIGTDYIVGKIVKYDKNGDEVIHVPKIRILKDNGDTVDILYPDHNIKQTLKKSSLEQYNLSDLGDIQADKKKNFIYENVNTIYKNYKIKDKAGDPVTGTLEYSPKQDKLIFVYKDDNNVVQRREVWNKQFVAQEGFQGAMIRAVGKRTAAAEKAEQDFGKAKMTISEQLNTRRNIITDLYNKSINRVEEINKQLEKNKEALAKHSAKIDELTTTIEGAPRKKTVNTFKQTINALSSLSTSIETENAKLSEERDNLEASIPFFTDFLENIEALPESSIEMISDLKKDIQSLDELIDVTNKTILKNNSLLNKAKAALSSAIAVLSDHIQKLKEANPNIPLSIDELEANLEKYSEGVDDFDKTTFTALVVQLESEISDFEKQLKIPGLTKKAEKLSREIDELDTSINEIRQSQAAKAKILQAFEDYIEQDNLRKEQEKQMQSNEVLIDELIGTHSTGIKNEFGKDSYEYANKKFWKTLLSSTIGIFDGKPHQERANKFGIFLSSLKEKDRANYKGLIVTSKTEDAAGVPGLINNLLKDLTPAQKLKYAGDDTIVLVIVKKVGSKYVLVDETGKTVNPGKKAIDSTIYQTFPNTKLTADYPQQNGETKEETMFRKDEVSETVRKDLEKQYGEWRTNQLAQDKLQEPQAISASLGSPEYVQKWNEKEQKFERDYKARTSAEQAGLITPSLLRTANLISISTTNTSLSEGKSLFNTPLGRVALRIPGVGLAKLFNRKFNDVEATTIFKVIHQLSKLASEKGTLEDSPESRQLLNWLKSVVYWGINKDKDTKIRKLAGYNSIWFEKVKENGKNTTKLFISGLSTDESTGKVNDVTKGYSFTPAGLLQEKDFIIEVLQHLYNNTDADKINKTGAWDVEYTQIVGINPDGTAKTVTWSNYQTYLLSEKAPDSSGNLTITRGGDEIPLTTQYRPLTGPDDSNRKAIYFTRNSSADDFILLKEEPKIITKEAEEKAPTAPIEKPVAQQGPPTAASNLNGVTPNFKMIGPEGDKHKVTYYVNGNRITEELNKTPDVLADPEAKAEFIAMLNQKQIIRRTQDSALLKTIMDLKEVDEDGANSIIDLLIFNTAYNELINTQPRQDPIKDEAPAAPAKPVVVAEEAAPTQAVRDNRTLEDKYNNHDILYELPTQKEGAVNVKDFGFFIEKDATDIILSNEEYPEGIGLDNYLNYKNITKDNWNDLDGTDRALAYWRFVELEKNEPSTKEKAPVVNEAPTSESDEEFDEEWNAPSSGPDDKNFRLKLLKEAQEFKAEDWTKAEEFIKRVLPFIPLYRVKNMIKAANGKQAWGMLHKASIYLVENAEVGTVYHEVFEAVWKMFVGPEEKQKIINEFRNREGSYKDRFSGKMIEYKNATDEELKEELAEEFRDVVLNNKNIAAPVYGKSLIGRMFSELIDFIKAFFTGEHARTNTADLFSKIGNGYYAKYNPYESKLSYANKGVIDIEDITADETSSYRLQNIPSLQQHDIIQHMTWATLKSVMLDNKSLFAINKINKTELYKNLKKEIFKRVKNIKDNLVTALEKGEVREQDKEAIQRDINNARSLWDNINNEWDDIVKIHKDKLKAYNIDFDENDESILTDDSNSGKADYQRADKIDGFRKANGAIKLLLSTLTETVAGSNGENYIKSSIGGVKLIPADQAYIKLLNQLHNSVDIDDMFLRLQFMAQGDPNYAALFNRLTNNVGFQDATDPHSVNFFAKLTQVDLPLVAAFWKTMKKQNADVISVFILPSGEVIVSDSVLSSASKQAKRTMQNSIVKMIKEDDSPYFTYNATTGEYSAKQNVKDLKFESNKLEQYIDFLKNIGVNFKLSDLESLDDDVQIKVFKKAVEGIRESFSKIGPVLTRDGKPVLYPQGHRKQGKPMTNSILALNNKTLNIDGQLSKLGIVKAVIESPDAESTYFNINGERAQTYIGTNSIWNLYNFLSSIQNIDQLNGTPYEYLLTDKFSQGSVLLEKMFDINYEGSTGDRKEDTGYMLHPVLVDGTINQVTGKKKESSKQSQRQRIIQELNANAVGIYYNLLPGDAALEHASRMHTEDNAFVTEDSFINDSYIRIFKNYFISEVNLSRNNRKNLVKGKNSKDLRFFKSIFADETKTKKADINKLHNDILNARNEDGEEFTPEALYNEFKTEIDKSVKRFIDNEADSTEALLRGFDIISEDETGVTANELLFTENMELTNENLKAKIKVLSVNYIIANIEYHKILYSDPYQYADELKRIKSFTSPGQPLVFGSDSLNFIYDAQYNKGYAKNDISHRDMTRDHLRSSTIADPLSVNDLKNYNDPWQESDGGGYILLNANSVVGLRSGEWNEDNEQQLRYDMAYEKVVKGENLNDKEKIKKGLVLNDEEKAFNIKRIENEDGTVRYVGKNPNVRSTYTPIKPIVRGNKDNGRDYNDVVLHKFALVPLSFRILHEMNPNSNAIRLYNKMQAEDVDYVVYNSGSKVGTEKVLDLYNIDGSFNTAPFETKEEKNNIDLPQGISKIPFSIFAIQSEVPSKDTPLVTQGSQITKLVTMDFLEAGMPIDFVVKDVNDNIITDFNQRYEKWIALDTDAKREKASPLYKEIKNNQKLLEAKIEEGYKTLLRKLGIKETEKRGGGKEFKITDKDKLIKTLRDEILKREVNDNILDSFEGFKKGDVILEATPSYQQIRNILYSIADKNVVSTKISGGQKVQIPSTLFEGTRNAAKLIETKEGQVPTYESNILKFYEDDDGKRVCEIMLGRWFDSNKTDEELLKYFNDTDEGKKILSGLAYRIPTQKQNSIDVFKIAKFLPKDFGDSVVVPSALVKKVGSDFDIDKLSVYLKNVYQDADGNIKLVPFYGSTTRAKAKFKELYKDLIDKKIKIVENKIIKQEDLQQLFTDISFGVSSNESIEKWLPIFKEWFADDVVDGKLDATLVQDTIVDRLLELDKKLDKLTEKDLEDIIINKKADDLYKQSLENEYIQSLENLVSHPLNFDNLIKPNSADQLKDISKDVVEQLGLKQKDFSYTGNMLNRAFMTNLRDSFVSGKYAIGIAATGQTNHAQNQRANMYVDTNKTLAGTTSTVDKNILGGNPKSEIFAKNPNVNFQEYNSVNVGGKFMPSLSMIKNAAGEYISDIIGMFIDGYVDISKGDWIMELGATPNVTSTWLFLTKIGVPIKTTAYFINQPIIRDYLKAVGNKGYSWLFIDDIIEDTLNRYKPNVPVVINGISSEKHLYDNLKYNKLSDAEKAKLSDIDKSEQQYILKEFLKYAKMAEHLFLVTQGSNFDTATINDSMLVYKKKRQLEKARTTVISSVDDLLNESFVGIMKNAIFDFRDAFAEILLSDRKSVRAVMEDVLDPYINLNDRDFVKVSQKAVNTLFDWAVQTKDGGLNTKIKRILLGNEDETSVGDQIIAYRDSILGNGSDIPGKPSDPLFNNIILNSIRRDEGIRQGKINSIYLGGLGNKIYDQNLIIYGFEELRKALGDHNKDLYTKLVSLAIVQSGLTKSPISFTTLLPYEDFKEQYNEVLSNLEKMPNLDDFYTMHVFERTNSSDDDVVESKRAKLLETKKGRWYNPDTEYLDIKFKNAINSDVIPKVISISPYSQEGRSDFMVYTWEDRLTKTERIEARKNGDSSHINKALMQKVYIDDEKGRRPLIQRSTGKDKEGNTVIYEKYIYKAINAWGDSYRANEFYGKLYPSDDASTLGQASVLDNDYMKVEEAEDSDIVKIYNGERLNAQLVVEPALIKAGVREYTPEKLYKSNMPANGVFVFGSNTEGRHGLGAANDAKNNFGAIQGQAEGLQGQSYAIVTKNLTKGVNYNGKVWNETGKKSVQLNYIGKGIQDLLLYAKSNPDRKFYITKLGSSNAGYSESEIKDLFEKLTDFIPDNVILPKEYEVRKTTAPLVTPGGQMLKDGKFYPNSVINIDMLEGMGYGPNEIVNVLNSKQVRNAPEGLPETKRPNENCGG